jgi:hypothetical protein
MASKKFKCLGVNLSKEMKDFYNENCKTLKKGTEENPRRWKDFQDSWIGKSIL